MGEESSLLPRQALDMLLQRLVQEGYRLVGPQVEQGAIHYRSLAEAAQLPWGYREQQQPGSYKLSQGGEGRAFAWANGPQALKPLFFAPQEPLWRVEKHDGGVQFHPCQPVSEPLAIIGVRSCDLAALALQDSHFLQRGEADIHYGLRREGSFIVAVNCSHPAATCFCAATGDGPNAEAGYDLLLDELDEGFAICAGSERSRALLHTLPLEPLSPAQQEALGAQRQQASQQQRGLPGRNLSGQLVRVADTLHWQTVAARCLACGNCTSVCPTCFCHSEHDQPRLDGGGSDHLRQWQSCFSADHSMLHGIPVRGETAHRYRQWLTHKFDHWHAQYGRSGCVGCGRCITWCPVGIDVTEELQVLCGGMT